MNNRGMSLISVLAALGLVGILAMGLMSLSQNMMGVMQAADFNSQIQDEMFIARVNLSKEHNCTANFKDLTVGSTLTSDQMKLRLAKSSTNLNLSKSYIIPTQDPSNTSSKMTITQMALKPYTGVDNLALLSISFEAKNSKMTGGQTRVREIPLEVVLVGGKIQTCSAGSSALTTPDDEDTINLVTSQGRACSSDPGGSGGAAPKDLRDYISDVCDYQDYPVTKGLLLKKADIQSCILKTTNRDPEGTGWSIRQTPRCKAVAELFTTESHNLSPDEDDLRLLSRNNIKNAEDCKKQKTFSEGNRVARKSGSGYSVKTCMNHQWTGLEGGMGSFSGYHEPRYVGDSDGATGHR